MSSTLTVTDGVSTANITLLGQYTAASFATASDGNGGTLTLHYHPRARRHRATFTARAGLVV
jgi:hypothetical protein